MASLDPEPADKGSPESMPHPDKGTHPSFFPYPIVCDGKHCSRPAVFKVASRWSDEFTWEWKTYGLVCRDCLDPMYESALIRQKACSMAPGESLGIPMVLDLAPGQSSSRMVRRADLELTSASSQEKPNSRETGA